MQPAAQHTSEMDGAHAFYFINTTQRPVRPRTGSHDPARTQASHRPFFKKSSQSKGSKSSPQDSSSSSRTIHSPRSGVDVVGNADEQATTFPPATLVRTKTETGESSEEKDPAANVASFVSGVRVGGNAAVLDKSRKVQLLTAEQKTEQTINREKNEKELAYRKASVKLASKGKIPQVGREDDHPHQSGEGEFVRNGSISSNSLDVTTSSGSSGQRLSSDPISGDSFHGNLFARQHGRRYLRDTSLPYPLPCDLVELHRQTLRTMLLVQVFGGPVCTPNFNNKHPKRVLEVACGSAYWSSLCHQFFYHRGHSVSFTGIDIAPLAPDMSTEEDMKWRFVQHDLRRTPLPFNEEEFDLVMIKDLSLVTPTTGMQQNLMDEYLRILKPGGTLEIWDGDHTLRMLLPHAPPTPSAEDNDGEDYNQERASATGTYTLTPHTPLTAPQNQYLLEYNGWISKALEKRKLTPMPCTHIRPMLLQESEDLAEIESRRLAIPLGEVRWEREGVGGAITKDGTSGRSNQTYPSKGKGYEQERRTLSRVQIAIRQTALLTVVQSIEALEPLLREVSGKGQDEWDRWQSLMMKDLMENHGTSWGECLEVGAWWATKKAKATKRPA